MDISTALTFIVGLGLLTLGGDWLVRGASSLAKSVGISSLVVGLTVVAFGTSAPELAVSVDAALTGRADIALGNVVGSNIFNVMGILGLCALILPLTVNAQLLRFDVPVMVGVSLLLLAIAQDGSVSRIEGLSLFVGLVIYTTVLILKSRRETRQEAALTGTGESSEKPNHLKNVGFIIAGLGILVLGSRLLVESAVTIAQSFGVSELVIGLTIVSVGTSLPEVAASVMASIKGERDIAVGNVVGSNIFNILSVLGLSAVISPHGVPVAAQAIALDIPIMIAVAVVCIPIFLSGRLISRKEGLLFFAGYVLYTTYLILSPAGPESVGDLTNIILYGYVPLTLGLITWDAVRGEIVRRKALSAP